MANTYIRLIPPSFEDIFLPWNGGNTLNTLSLNPKERQ